MTVVTESALRARVGRARHTVRIVGKVSALNVRAQMEYRGNFVASILLGILWQTSTLMFASVLLTRFKGGLGGFPSAGAADYRRASRRARTLRLLLLEPGLDTSARRRRPNGWLLLTPPAGLHAICC
jgi:hypothetical protein